MLIKAVNPGKQAIRLAVFSVLIGWVVGMALAFFPVWHVVELKVYDLFTVASPPKQSLPITIVGIDEASFTQMGQRWPWPRETHAKLVDKLTKAGAAVIAFDVLFSEKSSTPGDDEVFAAAIKAAGNVVLGADHAYHETASVRQWLRMDPIPEFTMAGATTGLVTAQLDPDAVVRQVPEAEDAFWRQSIKTLIRARPNMVQEPYVAPGSMIRHLGPARTFPYVSYYQVLNDDPAIAPDFFANQIVLVGREVRSTAESSATQGDLFATPFLGASRRLTPGVEVHATLIENAMMGQVIAPASQAVNIAVMSVALLLMLPLLALWHPLRSAVVMLLIAGAVVALAAWQFLSASYWLQSATPVAAVVAAFLSMATASYWIERRRATEIRTAFGKYVSEEVVNRMVAHPEELKLGGQRRELTVLFSDLAGFTSLSEKLAPEQVADVINLYLNEVTKVIMAHGGTVDKFIGDAVMAFWGAPLDDADHAMHGVTAAIAMQKAMDELQPRFAAMGASGVSMRVGVNSGPAIVGNMGSDLRFDYTALGDTVNLASRLEGANKAYGIGLLIANSTADLLAGRIELRRVDRVKVKGKNEAVDVFTPCDDAGLVAATERAWQAYTGQAWEAAASEWAGIDARHPGDALAKCFGERIDEMRASPPGEGWDGSVSLEKL
ncbi:MAG: adenylate/guanylate cyclase domain-containing protein [Pseudomonadota bacterium]